MYTFSHIPKQIDPSLYATQTSEAVSEFVKYVPDIVAIYTMGEQDLCGLSDIDFLCIIEDKTEAKIEKIRKISEQFSLLDAPHCIDAKSVELLSYFVQRPYLVHVWWKKFDIPEVESDAKIIFAWRLCFIGLLRIFYPAFYSKKISVALLLKQIYYLRYLVSFLEINDPKVLEFMSEYSLFRKTWFEHQDTQLLAEKYLSEAIDMSWNMIGILDAKLRETWISSDREENEIMTWRYPTLFSRENNRENTKRYFEHMRKSDRFLSLPHSFNSRNWWEKWKRILEKIRILDPQFARLDFASIPLKILLYFKKGLDVVSISYYKYFLLWKK